MEGENPENEKRIARIKRHLKENKKVYLIAGATGVSCFAAGYLLRKPNVITVINEAAAPVINNTVAPVMNNIGNQLVNNAGYCCKIVQDVNTEELWPKVNTLAEELAEKHDLTFDAARTLLSKHLNGHTDHVFGKQYVTYGLGTTG